MNDKTSEKKKDSILKSLAIAGFITILILIAWLSIQLVSLVPGAFSSLASLAEGVNQYQKTVLENEEVVPLNVTSNSNLVNVGETVELSWDTVKENGSYTFTYECNEGVAIDIIESDGVRSITCDTNYNVGNTDSLSLNIDSEKERYADVSYKVSFFGTNDQTPRAAGWASVTVVNGDIKDSTTEIAVDDDTESTSEEAVMEEETEDNTESETELTAGEEETVFEQEFTYTIPTSDPNGRTDLGVRFLDAGNIVGNSFVPGAIEQNSDGAVQFEVKNYGTKTSDDWEFSLSLPNGGTYSDDDQVELKPNERAIITVGFPTNGDTSHTFLVIVDEITDQNILNDQSQQVVTFR